MKVWKKVKKALSEGGPVLLVTRGGRFLYRKISPLLPQRYGKYNEVEVPTHRILGSIIESISLERPDYEEGIINSLEKTVRKEDKVVILGGGLGVSAVRAARLCASPSNVEVFEGSEKQIRKIQKTFRRNSVQGITLKHALIGKEIDVWGPLGDAHHVNPEDLPPCDVLEMDVEGAEIEVLNNLEIRPRVIIVETHGNKGAPSSKVKNLLKELGYNIRNEELAEKSENAKKNDIRVITAVKN